jgi:hypothetical protein
MPFHSYPQQEIDMIPHFSFFKKAMTLLLPMALLCGAAKTRADGVPVVKTGFSLTFPAGWDVNTYVPSDSLVLLTDTALEASAILEYEKTDHPVDLQFWRSALVQAYSNGFTLVDSGSKMIGGREFLVSAFTEDTAGSEDSTPASQGRFYITGQGNDLLLIWAAFPDSAKTRAVAEIEQALATLQMTAVSIRPLARAMRVDPLLDQRDALGRNRTGVTYRLPIVPLFNKPR